MSLGFKFWIGMTVFYGILALFGAIWEGPGASILGTDSVFNQSPSAGVYYDFIGQTVLPDSIHIPGGPDVDNEVQVGIQGLNWPARYFDLIAGLFTLDFGFFKYGLWGQVIRWVIFTLWLIPTVAIVTIFSVSWIFNRRIN